MKTRSVLIRFPGRRFTPESLLPDRQLAVVAADLVGRGHETRILDYATASGCAALCPDEIHALSPGLLDIILGHRRAARLNPLTRHRLRGLEEAWLRHEERVCGSVSDEVAALRPDLVVFRLAAGLEARGAFLIAARLQECLPNVVCLAMGPFVDRFGEHLLNACGCFDGLLAGDCEQSVGELADRISRREPWSDVPNMVYCHRGRLCETRRHYHFNLDALPAPCYTPSIYPAMAGGEKLPVFPIEDSRGVSARGHAVPWQTAAHQGQRLRSVRSLCREMASAVSGTRSAAFHVVGEGAGGGHVEALAHELTAHGARVSYSRCLTAGAVSPSCVAQLAASGCEAIGWRVDTGSRLLLEEYFGRETTIAAMEQALVAARESGLFTVARLTYPVGDDDFHTAAESERLVRRARPDAVSVELPRLEPGSAWYKRPDEFGLEFDARHYVAGVLEGCPVLPGPAFSCWAYPYRIQGQSIGKSAHSAALLADRLEEYCRSSSASASLALAARIAGYGGREGEYAAQLRQSIVMGDAEAVRHLLQAFDAGLTQRAQSDQWQRPGPMRIAVGN